MTLLLALASLISLIDLSLPAVTGTTTPGKSTIFLRGKIANSSGTSSLFIASSSLGDNSGINSASVFKSCNDKLSKNDIFDLLICVFKVNVSVIYTNTKLIIYLFLIVTVLNPYTVWISKRTPLLIFNSCATTIFTSI